MGIIEKLANMIGLKAPKIVNDVNKTLATYVEEGYIDTDEQNALRHYHGIKQLSKEYGEDVAYILGIAHEQLGFLYPPNSREFQDWKADTNNNAVGLEHAQNNIGIELDSVKTIQDIREPLQYLHVFKFRDYPEGKDAY